MEKAKAYATGIVNINTDGDYVIDDIKEMYKTNYEGLVTVLYPPKTDEGDYDLGGQSALARTIGVELASKQGEL